MIVTFWFDDDTPEAIKTLMRKVSAAFQDRVSVATYACSEFNLELYTRNRQNKALYAPAGFEKTGFYPVCAETCLPLATVMRQIHGYRSMDKQQRQAMIGLLACLHGIEGLNGPKHTRSRFLVTYGNEAIAQQARLWSFDVLDLQQPAHRTVLVNMVNKLRKQ